MKTFSYVTNLPKIPELVAETTESGRVYLSPNKLKLPSVTTVLGHANKDKIIQWRNRVGHEEAKKISGRASVRGTKFHKLLERYLGNEENFLDDVMPDMKQAFLDFSGTLDKIDNIHYLEASLFSETLGVAGRTDVIGEYDYVPSIIDFKTSLKPKKKEWISNYFEQGTAYSLMYEEMTGFRIDQVVVIISVDGTDEPQIFIEDRNDHINSLQSKIEKYYKETKHVC